MLTVITQDYAPTILQLIRNNSSSIDILSYVISFNIHKRSDKVNLIFSALRGFQQSRGQVKALLDFPRRHKPNYHTNLFAARRFKEAGIAVRFLHSGDTQHAKLFTFDHKISVVGSHNLTPTSVVNRYDISLLVDDPALVKSFTVYFSDLWSLSVDA